MSATRPLASATGVHKWYRRGDEHGNSRSLVPGRFGETRPGPEALQVLEDVDFSVGVGQAVGLVGDNGAGKSTLLRILAGVTRPSAGTVERHGSVAAALSLGVGFDPDLTGAENLGLTATLLGLTTRDLRGRRDAIVDFSGVGSFLDMPLRRYSNGMRSRLGLALIMSVEADLVLVDEALSVGDWAFRRQALERIRRLHADGTALVIVSHGLWTVAQLCDSITHLERGRVVASGEPAEVINDYLGPEHLMENDPTIDVPTLDVLHDPAKDPGVAITSLQLDPASIDPDAGFSFVARIRVDRPLDALLVVSIHSFGRVAFLERAEGPSEVLRSPGTWTVRGSVDRLPLGPGPYRVRLAAIEEGHGITIGLASRSATLRVAGDLAAAPGVHLGASFAVTALSPTTAAASEAQRVTRPGGTSPITSVSRPHRANQGDPAL